MIKGVLGLLLRAVVVLAGTGMATFALLWHAPGDPAQTIAMARHRALLSQDIVDQVREQAGLSDGFWSAFFAWAEPLLVLDFGNSSVTGRDVGSDLFTAVTYTFPLAIAGLLIGLLIALPLAILAARRPGSLMDRCAIAVASIGAAVPYYWLGLLLILFFAVQLSWLPAMGARTPAHAVLPALTLGLVVAANLTRIIRSGILEAREQSFLPALQRRAVPKRAIGRDHVAPHAAIPVITVLGLELAFLLEGTVVVEIVFGRPGLGRFLVGAIETRDFPQVQAVVLLTALVFVVVNLITDVVYRLIDPR
ncbi:MAG: ABC transporter permease, partial [Pseudomonadota bacterium]